MDICDCVNATRLFLYVRFYIKYVIKYVRVFPFRRDSDSRQSPRSTPVLECETEKYLVYYNTLLRKILHQVQNSCCGLLADFFWYGKFLIFMVFIQEKCQGVEKNMNYRREPKKSGYF